MGIHRNEFAANLNLKGHQFFFTHPVFNPDKRLKEISRLGGNASV